METTFDCTPQFLELSKILNKVDPINLISRGCPNDEYDSEVEDILELIPTSKSIHNLAKEIQDVFIKRFDEGLAGPYANYLNIAELIWSDKATFPTLLFKYEWLNALISGGINMDLIPRLESQKLVASRWETPTPPKNKFELSDGEAVWGGEERDRLLIALLYNIGLKHFLTIMPSESKHILYQLCKGAHEGI